MTRERFDKCIPFVFKWEGFRSDNPADPGKLTIWGIASAFHPNEVARMANMTADQAKEVAKEIYYNSYWLPSEADTYTDIRNSLAVFDTAVNCGLGGLKEIISEIGQDFTFEYFLVTRIKRYANRATKDPKVRVFFLGWVNRVIDMIHYFGD